MIKLVCSIEKIYGDQMNKYVISKLDNDRYDLYNIKLDNGKSCYYYEELNNNFVNSIDIIFGNRDIIKKFDNNKIYVFFDKNDSDIKRFISVFDVEFSNLKYNFIINDFDEEVLASNIIKELKLDAKVVYVSEYLDCSDERVNDNNVNQYSDYDILDNPYIKKEDEDKQEDWEISEDYANYNGYNKRLINDKVRNIVDFKKDSNKSDLQ